MKQIKEVMSHPIVLAAIWFFVVVIGTISFLTGFWKETHTIVTGGPTQPIINRTSEEVEDILKTEDVSSQTEVGGRGATVQDVYETRTSKWNTISINNFGEKATIGSPIILTGMIPNFWIFEGVFSVNIYSLEWELIKEWYGNANIFDENGEIIDGHVPFRALLEFEVPEGVYEGKIRFAADNPSGMVENEDVVEVMVLFE